MPFPYVTCFALRLGVCALDRSVLFLTLHLWAAAPGGRHVARILFAALRSSVNLIVITCTDWVSRSPLHFCPTMGALFPRQSVPLWSQQPEVAAEQKRLDFVSLGNGLELFWVGTAGTGQAGASKSQPSRVSFPFSPTRWLGGLLLFVSSGCFFFFFNG